MYLSLRNDSWDGLLVRFLLATGLALLPLSGCRAKPSGPGAPPVSITIACPRTVSSGLVIVANEKGYLARNGVQTTLIPFESGKAALDCMLKGGSDLAGVAETPIARAILEGGQLKVLACISQSSQDLAIVARKDKGIRAPADLRGKVIGYTKGTTGHFFLDTFGLVNRIHLDGTKLVDLSPSQLRSALIEGRVDAVSTWQPFVVTLTDALGPQAVVFRDEVIYTQSVFIVARPEFVRDHPAQVKALLEGLSAAQDTIAQAPREARDLLGTYLQVDPALVVKVFSSQDFILRLDQSHILSLENECHWFVDSGAVSRRAMPEVLPYFHLPGLLAVRPQAVQIIRDEAGARP